MVFSSTIFLTVFLPCVLVLYYNPFFKSRGFKNALLLFASLVFYAWGESLFVFVMLASILVNYFLAILIERAQDTRLAKGLLCVCVFLNVALLFVFKYMTFVEIKTAKILSIFSAGFANYIPAFEIALPIGISFFTFQIMSYCFDVYYKKVRAQHNFFYLALYISFFPQLIAGPIVRYNTIERQIQNRLETKEKIFAGMERFILGLAKKSLLADTLAVVADNVFSLQRENLTTSAAWLGAVFYTLQIYFDFSGYSDMAIGLGKIFGFDFEENFRYPYMASSITDFWRRWHISLSSWFKNYVYIPLAGSHCSKRRNILNLFCVWALTGIWHGAATVFFLWGIYYFALLVFERKFVLPKLPRLAKPFRLFYRAVTILLVVLGWVLFRSGSARYALFFVRKMFSFGFRPRGFFFDIVPIFVVSIICCFPIWTKVKDRIPPALKNLFLLLIFLWSLLTSVSAEYIPFIYFNF